MVFQSRRAIIPNERGEHGLAACNKRFGRVGDTIESHIEEETVGLKTERPWAPISGLTAYQPTAMPCSQACYHALEWTHRPLSPPGLHIPPVP